MPGLNKGVSSDMACLEFSSFPIFFSLLPLFLILCSLEVSISRHLSGSRKAMMEFPFYAGSVGAPWGSGPSRAGSRHG